MKALSIQLLMCVLAVCTLPQTAIAKSNPNIVRGCLSGSNGSFTLVEDETGIDFRIASSAIDLKPHLGHEVELVTQSIGEENGTHSVKVTELRMISEHCLSASVGSAVMTASNGTPTGIPRKKHAMPKTASPLPLLGGLGLALVAASWLFGKKRRTSRRRFLKSQT